MMPTRRPAAVISITNLSQLYASRRRNGYLIVSTVRGADGVETTRALQVTNRVAIGYVTRIIKLLSKRGVVQPQ